MSHGLVPRECTHFDIVCAHAAFADWWNAGGLTERDRRRDDERPSASLQLHRMRYSPGCGAYFTKDDYCAVEVYLALVERYHPDRYEAECTEWHGEEE